ncbi:MAG: orotate phosphoribosyltransferase [Thermodesulfobacteriota bacterium]
MNGSKKRLGEILREKSILKGEFKLASGKTSDYYIDGRLTTLDSEGLKLIGELFLDEILKDPGISAVGGPTMGADPIVGSVLTHSGLKNVGLNGFLVRKEEKQHGTGKLIEGNLIEGDEVAVVEDVVTTGGSVLKAIYALEKAGAKISKVLVIVDREEGAEGKIRELGYDFYSIFKISDLL